MHVNRSKIHRSVHPSSVSIHPPIHPLSLTVTKLHHRDIHEKQTIYCTCISQFVFCMCRKPWGCVLSRMLRYAPEAKSLEEVLLCICMGIAFMAAHPMLLRPLDKWGISSLLACINCIHILQRDYYVAWTGLERIDKEWNIVNDLCCNLLQRCIAAERGNRVFLNSPIQIHAHQTTLLVRDALLSKGPNSGLSVLLNL